MDVNFVGKEEVRNKKEGVRSKEEEGGDGRGCLKSGN